MMPLLAELKAGDMLAAVGQLERQQAAAPGPFLSVFKV
jgi:hypothetical protein